MKNIVHWNKQRREWSSHTYRGCQWAPSILIAGSWHAETKPEKRSNPRGWIVSSHEDVVLNTPEESLAQFKKEKRLIYDKEKVQFNVSEGNALLFDKEGAFVLERI